MSKAPADTLDMTGAMVRSHLADPLGWYISHQRGQRQFHEAPHIIRALWPGNGFGKTRAAGSEAAWWIAHRHPYQKTPRWPVQLIWCAETYKQFGILREQLQAECFGPERSMWAPKGWKYNKSEHRYDWPDGSSLWLISGDASWTHVQGINPDLVLFDEEPPRALWNEMRMRRRGKRKTRYCFAATATQGLTWMYSEVYLPWLRFHQELGLDELAAMREQKHFLTWAWPRGGIDDNPGADQGDRDYYHAQTFASDAEKQVRLGGGFADFSGLPVFDPAGLKAMEEFLEDGQSGTLYRVLTDGEGRALPAELPPVFKFLADGVDERGRVTIFEHPRADTRYVMGHDSAYGLVTGDWDYVVVIDRNTGHQVAEAQGHWGDVGWAEVLFGLHWYYRKAFMLGERQVGLWVMRRLYDEMTVTYQYFNRDEAKKAKRRSDTLGHHRTAGDLVIRRLRRAIAPRDPRGHLMPPEVYVHSRELHRQLVKYQFAPRRESIVPEEARDAELGMGAPSGDHDDGVMGLAYARMALEQVPLFEQPEQEYEEGTYGREFKVNERLGTGRKRRAVDPFAAT